MQRMSGIATLTKVFLFSSIFLPFSSNLILYDVCKGSCKAIENDSQLIVGNVGNIELNWLKGGRESPMQHS